MGRRAGGRWEGAEAGLEDDTGDCTLCTPQLLTPTGMHAARTCVLQQAGEAEGIRPLTTHSKPQQANKGSAPGP